MRKENDYNGQLVENHPQAAPASDTLYEAFRHLQSLPRNHDRPALDSYKRNRDSQVIDDEVAQIFTASFRGMQEPFYIPVSWSMTKSSLISLLGITDYKGYDDVNGVRFYAGLNDDNQLTLIAVSTMAGTGCNDDLTVEDAYPYYDYADPCPSSCSSRGSLRAEVPVQKRVVIKE